MVKCQEKETQEKNNCQLTANTERIIKSVYIFLNAFKKKKKEVAFLVNCSLVCCVNRQREKPGVGLPWS